MFKGNKDCLLYLLFSICFLSPPAMVEIEDCLSLLLVLVSALRFSPGYSGISCTTNQQQHLFYVPLWYLFSREFNFVKMEEGYFF